MNTLSESSVSGYNDSAVASRKTARGWGGKRPGAGRKPVLKDPVTTTADLERDDVDYLETIASKRVHKTSKARKQKPESAKAANTRAPK